MAEGLQQLPQYNIKVKNTFLEASVAGHSDSDDDLSVDLAFHKRQVTEPGPSTSEIICPKKINKDVDDSNGVDSTPKVCEEPELEPDLQQPYAQEGMARQVTEESWNTWETDSEQQSCVNSMSYCDTFRRTSWADVIDDPYDMERKPLEKVTIALSPALAMPAEAVAMIPGFGYPSVHAIAASALLPCSFDQEEQSFVQRSDNAKLKSGRRRKKESLIDQAARHLQKEEKNRRQQMRQNGKARGESAKQLVPQFCHQCGGACSSEFKFCRFCGVATIGAP